MESYFLHNNMNFFFSGFVLQACFLPPCHFLLKVLRVQWALDSPAHHWWAMGVCSLTALFIFHADSGNVFVNQTTTFVLILNPLCQQVDLLTPPTNTEEAEATMTTSADKVATWESRATLGETTVRVIFILLWAASIFCYWRILNLFYL